MRKTMLCMAMALSLLAASPAFANDIDMQINDLETQIEELQSELNELKAEKAQSEYDGGQSDALFMETDRIFYPFQNEYTGDCYYNAIIEITNISDEPLYLNVGTSTFDIEDDDGHLIQSDTYGISSCPDVIQPGEKGYFYNHPASDLDAGADINNIQFVPHYNVSKALRTPHEYPLSDISMVDDDYNGYKIVGRILNDTSETLEYVYINVMYYNSNGEIIGIWGANVTDNIAPGEYGSFEITSIIKQKFFNKEDVASYKLCAQEYYFQL